MSAPPLPPPVELAEAAAELRRLDAEWRAAAALEPTVTAWGKEAPAWRALGEAQHRHRRLLLAAAEALPAALAEVERLRFDLASFAVGPGIDDPEHRLCRLCRASWPENAAAGHKTGCPLASGSVDGIAARARREALEEAAALLLNARVCRTCSRVLPRGMPPDDCGRRCSVDGITDNALATHLRALAAGPGAAGGTPRMFPLHSCDLGLDARLDGGVPWSLLAPHETQALANHGQDLDKLAGRGGLSASEMLAVIEDRPWRDIDRRVAAKHLAAIVAVHRGPLQPDTTGEEQR